MKVNDARRATYPVELICPFFIYKYVSNFFSSGLQLLNCEGGCSKFEWNKIKAPSSKAFGSIAKIDITGRTERKWNKDDSCKQG
jgi:hypothetical protein